MYLSMRAIGFLVGAMILHGLTDPTTILASGALDVVKTTGTADNGFLTGANFATFPLIAIGLLLLNLHPRPRRGPPSGAGARADRRGLRRPARYGWMTLSTRMVSSTRVCGLPVHDWYGLPMYFWDSSSMWAAAPSVVASTTVAFTDQ